MAEPVTLSIKVDTDIRDKAQEMIKTSGMTGKDWLNKAISLIEIQSMKEQSTDFASDLSELEVHTTRIFELVGNMVQRSVVLRESAVRELEQKLEQQRELTSEYQLKVKGAVEEKDQALADLEESQKEQSELEKQLEELRATLETNKLLVNEYQQKNDTLTGLVTKYEAYATENDQLKETLVKERSSHQSQIEELTYQTNEQKAEIKELEQQKNSLTEAHKTALERLEERKDLEQEKALLQAERSHQKALTESNNDYSQKLQSLYEQLENERRGHEKRVQELQQQLEIERTKKSK